jgi:hypothetical protein
VKRVVSLSLGSSKRDKTVTADLFGETFEIARIGTNGDEQAFMRKLADLDGTVDAIGFGGMDRYVWSAGERYEFAAARRLLAPAKVTPVLDGSGLKNTLEREAVRWLAEQDIVDFSQSNTLMVCGVDRFGMSESLVEQGGPVVFGDLMFALGLPFPIKSWNGHRRLAKLLLPIIMQLPVSMLYPTGEKQNQIIPHWDEWYGWADVIAGDYLYIGRNLPLPASGALAGKTILTNTTTEDDVKELTKRGVRLLITTTPNFEGRSFGTNVMEAVLVAHHDGQMLTPEEYMADLKILGWTPTVRNIQEEQWK